MYVPAAFRETDLPSIHRTITDARLANLVTATPDGPFGTPLPLLLDPDEGALGTLYGHVARANPQWRVPALGHAMAVFMGPDAYVSPSWYEAKARDGRVVPTWNYVAVYAYGPVEFFDEPDRLHDVVRRLTALHEASRPEPWAVEDAPDDYVQAQLRGIVGVRLEIARLDAKRKMSQNRTAADRSAIRAGLSDSPLPRERDAAGLVPE